MLERPQTLTLEDQDPNRLYNFYSKIPNMLAQLHTIQLLINKDQLLMEEQEVQIE
jgi:hypothetical protein